MSSHFYTHEITLLEGNVFYTQCILCAVFYRNKLTSGNPDGIRGGIWPRGEHDSRTGPFIVTPAIIADACRPKIREPSPS